jgi:DNA-binding transcriptional MocR family regulator
MDRTNSDRPVQIPPSTPNSVFRYLKVASEIGDPIRLGQIAEGTRLPSVRTESRRRGVSVSTIIEAYWLLEREGLIEARPRSGHFVAAAQGMSLANERPDPRTVRLAVRLGEVLSRAEARGVVPLGSAVLGRHLLPGKSLVKAFRRCLQDHPEAITDYGPVAGEPELRRELGRLAFVDGWQLDPSEIVVTAGASEAISLALRAVTSPGDAIGIERPTYFGVLEAIETLDLRAVELPTGAGAGHDLGTLAEVAERSNLAAIIVMPTCHNPTGRVMPERERRDLVELCHRLRLPLIEDDVFGDLVFAGPRPLPAKAFDRDGLVIRCSSFSKTLGAGLRVGWIEAGQYAERIQWLKAVSTLAVARLPQLAVASVLEDGSYERHWRHARRQLARQVDEYRNKLMGVLPVGSSISRPAGGFLLWIRLPSGLDGDAIHTAALDAGVATVPGSLFSADGEFRDHVRISCGPPFDQVTEEAVSILGQVVQRALESHGKGPHMHAS